MEVTFVANSRILNYRRGDVVKTELTPHLRAILQHERHLVLIDPPELPPEGEEHDSRKSSNNSKEHRSTNSKDNRQSN